MIPLDRNSDRIDPMTDFRRVVDRNDRCKGEKKTFLNTEQWDSRVPFSYKTYLIYSSRGVRRLNEEGRTRTKTKGKKKNVPSLDECSLSEDNDICEKSRMQLSPDYYYWHAKSLTPSSNV